MISIFNRITFSNIRNFFVRNNPNYHSFSSISCWNCDQMTKALLFCDNCGSIQSLESKDINFYEIFDLRKHEFLIDKNKLDVKFKDLQKLLHPDKFASKSLLEQEASSVTSSTINQGYQILKDPIERIRYLLTLKGYDVLDEGGTSINDPQLLLEMYELREEVDEADNESDLKSFLIQIGNEFDHCAKDIHETLNITNKNEDNSDDDSNIDYNHICKLAIRLKYYGKVAEEIKEKLQDM